VVLPDANDLKSSYSFIRRYEVIGGQRLQHTFIVVFSDSVQRQGLCSQSQWPCGTRYSPHFTRKSLRWGGVRGGGEFSGRWTKVLLLVENSMTHQGVILLHTD
jgi:hypothetical protein